MGVLSRVDALRCSTVAGAVVLLAASWPLSPSLVRAAKQPLVIVVMAAAAAKDIDLATLRRAFMGQSADLVGKRLIPINHPNGTPLRTAFDQQVLGLAAADVGKFWIAKRIRDEGVPPKTVPSAELAVRITASLPGAITYSLPSLVNSSVRVLTVGGVAPGQADYPLSL